MSITDPNTVLIVGAGVSAPFGLPLGGPLIQRIAAQIDDERRLVFSSDWAETTRTAFRYASQGYGKLRATPIHGAIARKWTNSENAREIHWPSVQADAERLLRLRELLADQTSETIDDFIVENPSYAEVAKLGIATILLGHTYWAEPGDHPEWQPNPFQSRHVGPHNDRNWVHLLINIIRHGIRKGAVTEANKVKIITFNYDRILEYVLESQFHNTEANHGHYSKYVDILHVHGCFEPIQRKNVDFVDMVRKCASGIHVVNEPVESVPELIKSAREQARAVVKEAQEVFAVGFSFAAPNCQMIGLDDWGATPRFEIVRKEQKRRVQKRISYCNFDGNVGVKRSVDRLCQLAPKDLAVEEAQGTYDRELGVSDWLKSGQLGELPG